MTNRQRETHTDTKIKLREIKTETDNRPTDRETGTSTLRQNGKLDCGPRRIKRRQIAAKKNVKMNLFAATAEERNISYSTY